MACDVVVVSIMENLAYMHLTFLLGYSFSLCVYLEKLLNANNALFDYAS